MLAIFACGIAAASPEAIAKRNVALFDELVHCSQLEGFKTLGLGTGGPCAGWVGKIEAQRNKDSELIRGGYLCLAGDIRLAGNSLISGDREHFAWVKDSVEECRSVAR